MSVGPVDVGAEFVSVTGGCCTNYFDESLLVWTCGGDCACGGTGGHGYVVNHCGVGVGKDVYFRIQGLPNDCPDEKIVWSNETAGAVDFVGGNTGRSVTVRGISPGTTHLTIHIGDSPSDPPHFPPCVVANRASHMTAWITAVHANGVKVDLDEGKKKHYPKVGFQFRAAFDRIVS